MKKAALIVLLILFLSFTKYNQRLCCSWHGGIYGCSNERIVCCNGSYSPSFGVN